MLLEPLLKLLRLRCCRQNLLLLPLLLLPLPLLLLLHGLLHELVQLVLLLLLVLLLRGCRRRLRLMLLHCRTCKVVVVVLLLLLRRRRRWQRRQRQSWRRPWPVLVTGRRGHEGTTHQQLPLFDVLLYALSCHADVGLCINTRTVKGLLGCA